MKILTYRVRFTTPAFLGNVEQSGQWYIIPFIKPGCAVPEGQRHE